jgi:hypothetical protein
VETKSAGCIKASAGQGSEVACAASVATASNKVTNFLFMGYI